MEAMWYQLYYNIDIGRMSKSTMLHQWKLESSLKRKVTKSVAIQTDEEPKPTPEKEF